MRLLFASLLLAALACLARAGETTQPKQAAFAAKPSAAKAGDKYKIDFALSAAADVEVAVLGADGKVVRHLAAGVLGGKNPPPEPLKAGLAQSLEWDGRDDFGKPAAGGPFKVRVRAGMSVKFGKIFGGSPFTGTLSSGGPCDGVAVDSDGAIFVKLASLVPQLHEGNPWQLRKFDKDGKYVRTLLPYPPSTPPDKTPGFRLIETDDGQLTPAHTSGLDVVLFRFGDNIYNRVVDGQAVFIDSTSAKLTFFKVDGSNAVKVVPMRSAPDKLKWAKWLAPQLAFSPDGKYAYYSNVANTPYAANVHPSKMDQNFPQGRVYRQDLTKPGSDPEKFYDLELPDYDRQKYWLPDAWNKCTAAYGVTVDAKGHVFVCDLVNQAIVEVSPEGKKLSVSKAPWPEKVLVNSATGDFYVVSRLDRPKDGYVGKKLIKISGRGDAAKVVAEMPLKGDLGHSLALDDSGGKSVLWLGGGGALMRVEDTGAAFAPAEKSLINPDRNNITFVCYGAVDQRDDFVFITTGMGPVWRYNGVTGEGGLAPFQACDVAVGPDGLVYGWSDKGSYQGPIARYTSDGKPAPLASTGKHLFGHVYGRFGRGNNAPGITVDYKGNAYVNCGFNDCHVRAYDAEGKLIEYERKARVGDEKGKPTGPAFISYVLDQGGSLRADPANNIYVLELGLLKGVVPPKGFEKDPAFARCTGSIYKFTQKGGEFKKTKDGWDAEGAVAAYTVPCGPISGSWASTQSVCHCTRPRFDVDPYGRLYIPNGVTFNVTVIDNADNPIVKFGGYGNFDAQGPESKEPKPDIPMGWPIFAGASDEHIYVGDGLNHRVVRADKVFAASETCEVR